MTPWILLRGLARESRHWGAFPNELSAQLPSAQVLPLDLPGNGCYWRQHSPSTVELMVEHYRSELASLQIKPPYSILALSLGAMVATAWCNRYPHEIEHCVLINTSFAGFSPFWQRLRPGSYGTFLQMMAFTTNRLWREQQILRLTSSYHQSDSAIAEQWFHYASECPASLRNFVYQIVAAIRFNAPPIVPPTPVLLLASAADQLVNPQCSQDIAERWAVPLMVHPTAGHDLPLDDGHWVISQIITWLNL